MVLGDQGVGFRSLTENIDTTSFGQSARLPPVRSVGRIRAGHHSRANQRRPRPRLAREGASSSPTPHDREVLKLARALIADPSWTRDAIAAEIGVSHVTVYRELERAGITTRKAHPATPDVDDPLDRRQPGPG